MNSQPGGKEKSLIRIPDQGMTELIVTFADDFVLEHVPPGAAVLDMGCGRGVFTEALAEKATYVTGVDLIPEVIEVAIRRSTHRNVTYRCMDAAHIHTLNRTFDLIVSRFCFHHLEMDKVADSIKNSLRLGGKLIVVDCYEEFWTFKGRMYVMDDARKLLGMKRLIGLLPRFRYFFTLSRIDHVRRDIKRLKAQRRYTLEEFKVFYQGYFPGAVIKRLGCAATIEWVKP